MLTYDNCTEEIRFEHFLEEYKKLCITYGMGLKIEGMNLCAVIDNYCDGFNVFEIIGEIERIKNNHRPEHLEPILLDHEYIQEDQQ